MDFEACFGDQNDWLFSTLDYFVENKHLLKKFEVIIRFHPLPVYAEGKNIDLENFASSSEYSYNIFKKRESVYRNLFTVIEPYQRENSNTLELIKVSYNTMISTKISSSANLRMDASAKFTPIYEAIDFANS